MGHERPFQHIHPVAARMRVFWVDHSGGITNEPNQDVCLRIGVELLSQKRAADSFVETFFPGHVPGVDGDELVLVHGGMLPQIGAYLSFWPLLVSSVAVVALRQPRRVRR